VLGDIAGEETGSPGCSCVLSMNKNVIILSSAGAAVTIIDGRSMNVVQTVVVLSVGGEFGRPSHGFTVTETGRTNSSGRYDGYGIGIDAENVKVGGNRVVFSRGHWTQSRGQGIFTVNSAIVRIEGNDVMNWWTGIAIRVAGAAIVSNNQVTNNRDGVNAAGGSVIGNVATANATGIYASGATIVSGNAAYMNEWGFTIEAFTGLLTRNNIVANGCGLENLVGPLQATNNYWGVATGPGIFPADNTCFMYGATTSPFATTPFQVQILKP
jgi:parallel beta-helix repeat protein